MTDQIWPELEPIMPILVTCKFDEDWIHSNWWRHYFLYYKSMGKKICDQGQITSKWIIRSGPNLNSFKLSCLSLLPASFTKKQRWLRKADIIFFIAQGHVTPKWLVRYNRNSNWSEILCLSSLPVSLMKTAFIVTKKRWRHHFPHSKSMGMLKGE